MPKKLVRCTASYQRLTKFGFWLPSLAGELGAEEREGRGAEGERQGG